MGLSDRRIDALVSVGVLELRSGGVLVAGGRPPDAALDLRAAVLGATTDAVVCVASHRTAAHDFWHLNGVAAPPSPEFTVLSSSRTRLPAGLIHRTDHIGPGDLVTIGGLLVTAPPKTLLDLGAVVAPHIVEMAFEDAFFRKLVTWKRCEEVLAANGGRGRRGAGVFRTILESRGPGDLDLQAQSVLERRTLRFLRREGLHPTAVQVPVRGPNGEHLVVDLGFGERRGIEVDSRRWHSGEADVARNTRKAQLLKLVGWSIFPVTTVDLDHRPHDLAREIRSFLGLL